MSGEAFTSHAPNFTVIPKDVIACHIFPYFSLSYFNNAFLTLNRSIRCQCIELLATEYIEHIPFAHMQLILENPKRCGFPLYYPFEKFSDDWKSLYSLFLTPPRSNLGHYIFALYNSPSGSEQRAMLQECHRRDCIIKFAPSMPDAVFNLPLYLQQDDEVIRVILKHHPKSFKHFHSSYWNRYEFAKLAVEGYAPNISFVSKELQLGSDLVTLALEKDLFCFAELADELRDDKQLALSVLSNRFASRMLVNLSHELRNDRDFILEVAKKNGNILAFASGFRDDEIIVKAAVESCGVALCYATERFKCDRDIVLRAVKEDGWALQYAHRDIRKDLEIVLTAVESNTQAWKFVELPLDQPEILQALRESIKRVGGKKFLRSTHRSFRFDKIVVLECIEDNAQAYKYASDILRADEAVTRRATRRDVSLLGHCPNMALRHQLDEEARKRSSCSTS